MEKGMQMMDLGKKMSMESNVGSKDEAYYPEITITEKVLPGLKGENVGDIVDMVVEAEVCSVSSYGNGDIDYRLRFKKAALKKDTENSKT